jgi:hypothetical protein
LPELTHLHKQRKEKPMDIVILEITETTSGKLKFCPAFHSGSRDVVITLPVGVSTIVLEKEEEPWRVRLFATDIERG